MPIVGLIGKPGSGKTLMMTQLCHKEKIKGRKVVSNYGYKYNDSNFVASDLINNIDIFDDVVLACDEMHVFMDSREHASKKNKLISVLITQTRKLDVDLLFTTQRLHQVDRRLRDLTDIIIECKSRTVDYDINGEAIKIFIYKFHFLDDGKVVKVISDMRETFGLYDTKEVIRDFTAHEIEDKVQSSKNIKKKGNKSSEKRPIKGLKLDFE